jgi:hypothetical protein
MESADHPLVVSLHSMARSCILRINAIGSTTKKRCRNQQIALFASMRLLNGLPATVFSRLASRAVIIADIAPMKPKTARTAMGPTPPTDRVQALIGQLSGRVHILKDLFPVVYGPIKTQSL